MTINALIKLKNETFYIWLKYEMSENDWLTYMPYFKEKLMKISNFLFTLQVDQHRY